MGSITDWAGWNALPVLHFIVLSATMIAAALGVVIFRNLIHAALCLVVVFGVTAGFFVLLNAEFLAFAQILIYMGGISILIIFGIMLSRKLVGWDIVMTNRQSIPAAIVCTLLGGILLLPPPVGFMHTVDWSPEPTLAITREMLEADPVMAQRARAFDPVLSVEGFDALERHALERDETPVKVLHITNWYQPNAAVLGQSLMSTYTLIFWVASFILTMAMIGALYIARKDDGIQVDPREEAPPS